MSKREWKPGDVAMVNNTTGGPDEPATCIKAGVEGEREAEWLLHRLGARVWSSVSEARPLVVIDPEGREQVERLVADLEALSFSVWGCGAVSAMQAALREFANPKPPKPEEPKRVGAVAKDQNGRLWINATDTAASAHSDPWMSLRNPDKWASWGALDVVEVFPEGIPL